MGDFLQPPTVSLEHSPKIQISGQEQLLGWALSQAWPWLPGGEDEHWAPSASAVRGTPPPDSHKEAFLPGKEGFGL